MKIKLLKKMFFLVFPAMLAWGCGMQQVRVEPIAVTENPRALVDRLNSEIGAARKNQVNVLAPVSFASAERNLAGANAGLDGGEEISMILDQVAQGRAQLKRANENAEMSRTALAKVIKARDDARAAGAPIFERDYTEAESGFFELTEAIERDNLTWAQKNQEGVVTVFKALELRAIKEKTLKEVRDTIAVAEKEGARKIAPELHAEAIRELEAVDDFISENPYDKEAMVRKAKDALFMAHRLLELARQSARFKEMRPVEISLWAEGILEQITGSLSAPDMRNESFDTQTANIRGTIDSVQSDRQFMGEKIMTQNSELETLKNRHQAELDTLKSRNVEEVTGLNARIAALEGKSKEEQEAKKQLEDEKRANEARLAAEKQSVEQRLAADRKFNKLYSEVQTYFSEDEAEVYKQGSRLVIRLRAIQFPVGKAIIMPDNYALLSKVQRAVRNFKDPSVVIEGHTDSTGSAATNEHLSQQRAEAVREYLVANQTLPVNRVTAIGYGPVRPLASNATPKGRAVNRRIDVIITPEVSPER